MHDSILLIEDDSSLRRSLITFFSRNSSFKVEVATLVSEAKAALATGNYSLILCDFKLPDGSGLDILHELRESDDKTPFVMMTAYGSIEIATTAMKQGANEFITKPFEPLQLLQTVTDVITHRRTLRRALLEDRNSSGRKILTSSSTMKQCLHFASRVARVDTPVLITGESGTGKELLARYIHDESPRAGEAFIPVHCAALPAEILESELFGHESGAYTGATQKRTGLLEHASSGTLFLDEIGDMSLTIQIKLLRALQEQEVRPVGSNRAVRVTPRIIASTNHCIDTMLEKGTLREDFYYRIAVMTLQLPPLREREDDLELLAEHFLKLYSERIGKPDISFSTTTLKALRYYPWPGNIRELENVIERAVILAEKTIHPEHLGLSPQLAINLIEEATHSLQQVSRSAAMKAERNLIEKTLRRTMGNKSQAAKLLKVSYKTLLSKVKEYGLEEPESPEQIIQG